ncbi:synaptotagmin-like protein 2 isoform X2 [Syngnathus typhle]|uniref:synaptotagmin-like protein 2 isoform X2 n=1 Tax=Syngnathus typhle TaxID=161592 RepID=UPI002A6B1534|nr:synaptotagmin-like protein 2 isoform X2 [Syngnathus typhle]
MMIDLSFLTEEERVVIMTVLRRDAQLKQADEQRIKKLESIVSQGPSSDSKLKYLTGQWFYDAKSRRHMDKIHGSEIILASMKQRSASEGCYRPERPRAFKSPSSDVAVPQKPARCLDMPQEFNNLKKEDLVSAVHSPRMTRRNPFNRASLLVDEPAELTKTEPTSLPKHQQARGSSQTSGNSATSEGSSKPIPKKRTFVTKAPLDLQVAPAPRPNLYQNSSGSSNRSTGEAVVSAHPSASAIIPQQGSQVLSHSSLVENETLSFITAHRHTEQMIKDNFTRGRHQTVERIRDHDPVVGGSEISSVEEPEWQKIAEAPISYDINFIESSEQKTQRSSQQKRSFKLTNPAASSPTGDNDEDSISKVLDWFNRRTDSSNLVNGKEVSREPDGHREAAAMGSEEVFKKAIQEKEIWTSQPEGAAEETMNDMTNDDITGIKLFEESTTPVIPGDKTQTGEGNETRPNIPSVINVVNASQHVGLKQDQDLDRSNFRNYAYPEILSANPQVADRKGSDVELLCVEPLVPEKPLRSSPDVKNQAETLQQRSSPDVKGVSLNQAEPLQQFTESPSPESEHTSQLTDLENICKTPENSSKDCEQSPEAKDTASPQRQKSTAEKIKQLKTFWEQEAGKPTLNGAKRKSVRGAKMTKRFTKSEFDLRTIGDHSGSDGEGSNRDNRPLNQTIDQMSPSLGGSRAQFSSLLEFWDETTADPKTKSPKRQINTPQPPEELGSSQPEPRSFETSHVSANDPKKNLPESAQPKEPQKILKDSSRVNKTARPPPTPPREVRSPKRRKDSFSHSSGRGRSLRRATSMFALVDPQEPTLKIHVSPVQSQSRKPSGDSAQSVKGTETPLARAFVPRDYSHYLGMANEPGTLPPEAEISESFGGPVRTSTPTGSKKNFKPSPPQARINYSSPDADPESPLSNTSESLSNSRNIFKCKEDEENPVRKALQRAEARPKGLAKSMEDLVGSLSPTQERRQEPKPNTRRTTDDATTLPSPRPFSEQERLKKMSKSVPSFLQTEDDSQFYEDVLHPGIHTTDSSFDLASVSSFNGSVMTMDFGNVDVQGSIHFSINYVQKLREFHIFVAQCQDLAAADLKRGRSDPYVKSYLVPDKLHLGKKKTSVKKKTLNPTFNEILRYHIGIESLKTQILVLSVWHHDTFGRNTFLGEVDVDLSKWDFDHTRMNDLPLKAKTRTTLASLSGRGEMRLAVRFLPKVIYGEAKHVPRTGEIHIWVKECRNLPLIRATIDPYVKCFVLPDTSRKSRQKTRVLRRTANPLFNHTMVYDGIRAIDLTEACVELTVWDRDKLASNLLGGIRLGTGRSYGSAVDWMDSTPGEVALWERMLASPNEWAEGVLPLRVLSSAKTAFK